jgi:hypothetical protein
MGTPLCFLHFYSAGEYIFKRIYNLKNFYIEGNIIMKKRRWSNYNFIVLPLMLMWTSAVSAGIGERAWNFQDRDVATFNLSDNNPIGQQGAEYGCSQFTPTKVSFIIIVEGDRDPEINTYNTGSTTKITEDVYGKKRNTFLIADVEKLNLKLWNGTNYLIQNTTGTPVHGLNCDTGHF